MSNSEEEKDITHYIRSYVAPVVEEETKAKKDKITPFTFITAVSETKKDLLKENPQLEKEYNPFIINRGFSYFPDTALFANELNMYPDMPKKAQFQYYMQSLRRRKRFSKWFKLEKNPDLLMVQEIYSVRPDIAKQYLKLLSEDDLVDLRKTRETGENK